MALLEPEHGSRSRYESGCRCEVCRGKHAARIRTCRLRRKLDLVHQPPADRHTQVMGLKSLPVDFRLHVELVSSGCWEWSGHINDQGYGFYCRERLRIRAHRFVYESLLGPIPLGLELDHKCRNKKCCNPSHLEAVTHAENMRRAGPHFIHGRGAHTHCQRGHAFEGANLYVAPNGHRGCKVCRQAATSRYRDKIAAGG